MDHQQERHLDHTGGVGDLFLTWADHEAGGFHFDSSPAFVFAPHSSASASLSVSSSSIPSSTSTAPAPSPADIASWPLFSPAPSTAAPSFSDTTPTTAPSTTPASLLSAISTPLLPLDSYPGPQKVQLQQQQQQQQPLQQQFSIPVQDDLDWSSCMTMSPADPIMLPAGLGMPTHHHNSPSSSVGATMATSTATQSRTPPLSLSPAYSSDASHDGNVDNDGNNNLQFLSFLDLSSLAASTTPAPVISTTAAATVASSVAIAPSMSSASSGAKVAGLTLTGAGIHKKSGAGGARVKKANPSNDGDEENDNDPDLLLKRQRNSLAARKYRQKKIDRISELEAEVGQLQGERDALRIQLARQEAETAALREMLLVRDRDREDDSGNAKRRKRK
ncbi:hypothetical protein SBRCBS47491_000211 [Sporothrix bragantina]|uniref:BZIP domain-containing protein n=1 Tax=Sporothrix bragantina TaxID=671064 RepID=A0ABP0ANF2_9PEZI